MYASWEEFSDAVAGKRIICYGAGANALIMLGDARWFAPFLAQIDCFIDGDTRKHGTTLKAGQLEFRICPPKQLDEINEDCVVLITLTDFVSVGEMLTSKGIPWFPWTVISTRLNFDSLPTHRADNKPRLFLLGTPDYPNLGDQAIAVAECAYLERHFGHFYEFGTYSCHPYALSYLQKYIQSGDIIMIQGGGNVGSLWRVHEEIFRNVLLNFPDNNIVVFPQSIYYGESKEERAYFGESQLLYNSHRHLLLCVRDKRSYDFVRRSYSCKCMVLPDMVLTLKTDFCSERSGIGVLLRNDKEQSLPDDYAETIRSAAARFGEELKVITHHPIDTIGDRQNRVNTVLKKYAGCRLVITDRLHGMIFAAITNTPCIAFDNSYHKISDLYTTWLKDCPCITFTQPLSNADLCLLVACKLRDTYPPINTQAFMDKLGSLTDYISTIIKGE